MDPIQSIGVPQLVRVPASGALQANAPAVPQPAGKGDDSDASLNIKAAEQNRYDAVMKAASDIANIYVVGDQRFTIFKDATGQYITRFTSLRDGKVTYIPEPQLFGLGGTRNPGVSLKLEA